MKVVRVEEAFKQIGGKKVRVGWFVYKHDGTKVFCNSQARKREEVERDEMLFEKARRERENEAERKRLAKEMEERQELIEEGLIEGPLEEEVKEEEVKEEKITKKRGRKKKED